MILKYIHTLCDEWSTQGIATLIILNEDSLLSVGNIQSPLY